VLLSDGYQISVCRGRASSPTEDFDKFLGEAG